MSVAQSVTASTVQRCAWCERQLPAGAPRLAHRVTCPACGVATTDPWPSEEQLERAYAGWYRPDSGRFSGLGDAFLTRARGRLARRLDRIACPGAVLDVGSGEGALLQALRRQGREATGLERSALGAGVRTAEIEEIEGSWAAVVFWHSLEHLRDPTGALAHAARLLAPGGVLVVAIPNAASLQARAFKDSWFALDFPRHLVHVPAAALLERLRELGLEIERVSHARAGQVLFGWLHGLVGLLPGAPDLYDAIRRPQARRAALAARQRALALMAAIVLAPLAATAAAIEVLLRRGGTVYVEARRA